MYIYIYMHMHIYKDTNVYIYIYIYIYWCLLSDILNSCKHCTWTRTTNTDIQNSEFLSRTACRLRTLYVSHNKCRVFQ